MEVLKCMMRVKAPDPGGILNVMVVRVGGSNAAGDEFSDEK